LYLLTCFPGVCAFCIRVASSIWSSLVIMILFSFSFSLSVSWSSSGSYVVDKAYVMGRFPLNPRPLLFSVFDSIVLLTPSSHFHPVSSQSVWLTTCLSSFSIIFGNHCLGASVRASIRLVRRSIVVSPAALSWSNRDLVCMRNCCTSPFATFLMYAGNWDNLFLICAVLDLVLTWYINNEYLKCVWLI
jgi:hypothetical protein